MSFYSNAWSLMVIYILCKCQNGHLHRQSVCDGREGGNGLSTIARVGESIWEFTFLYSD
ncbi:hypothetical protein EDB73_101463 [Vibrio crassostreae]|nr:hypothetical protein EDB58_104127 [Vibrio crassostreae]ROO74384.1 hypothetical protein EDB57_0815 [Vibrio crassostreae]ROO76955.1 hypothetical protein EDB53_0785 [Vibrio crassostreae]ROP23122.1 hypothetical protein EDB33_103227 [Vibrio crassostreae]ROP23760.1 hypothetical protein EDB34_103227 [Vibrio crassostreae]